MKTCSKCKQCKPIDCFGKSSSRKDGLNVYCLPCAREVSRKSAAKNPEKARERSREWAKNNKERHAARVKVWADSNPQRRLEIVKRFKEKDPERVRSYSRKWYANNRQKALASDKQVRESNLEKFLEKERASYAKYAEKRRAKSDAWRANNPARVTFHAATRRSAIAQRTPPWLTHEQYEWMRAIFLSARLMTEATGELHHVDHIVPLRGKLVSGLNVPWNLQVITAIENLKKTNRHDI